MSARFSWNQGNTRGNRPRLQSDKQNVFSDVSRSGNRIKKDPPGFAFLLPWSFDVEGGGVAHAVVGLAEQCRAESRYRPIALEMDWEAKRPLEGQWRDMPRI